MKLYVVTHKEVAHIPQGRTLIGVGKNHAIDGVTVYDYTGDNIADKNANYCELTALYWMWKNATDDIIGLEHYRRFFCKKNLLKAVPLKPERIAAILKTYDIILPKRNRAEPSIYGNYAKKHFQKDMDICLDVIRSTMPEYADDVQAAMSQKKETVCNMFVMSKTLMDEYCAWLFAVLFEAEKRMDLTDYNDYQKRVFGFLSERLFNVWLYHKKLKCYYTPIYDLNVCPWKRKAKGLLRRIKRLFGCCR